MTLIGLLMSNFLSSVLVLRQQVATRLKYTMGAPSAPSRTRAPGGWGWSGAQQDEEQRALIGGPGSPESPTLQQQQQVVADLDYENVSYFFFSLYLPTTTPCSEHLLPRSN